MPAPEISAFGDGAHNSGESGLVVDGGGFGGFPGSAWIFANSDRTGAFDQLTIASWNDIQLGVAIPGVLNNTSGTRYLFLQREDLAWSGGFAFTLTTGGVVLTPVDITQLQVHDAVGLSQAHQLAPADITQLQANDAAGLSQSHLLAPIDATQLQQVDGTGLIIDGVLVPVALAQLAVLDSLTLQQVHVLSVSDITQLQILDLLASGSQAGSRVPPPARVYVLPQSGVGA